MKDFEKIAKAYALKNAISHGGKAAQGNVISSLFHEGLQRSEIGKYVKEVAEIVKQVNSLGIDEQEREFEKFKEFVSERETHEGLEELPDVPKSGVVMRFRPAPSGPMHVGHLISNLASSLYVKKYGGKFYVIIDDTDPQTTLPESYANLKKDCKWAFGNIYKFLNASDRMELYYKYAKELIEKDAAYVCTCPSDIFRVQYSEKKRDCPCRKQTTAENLERWNRMLNRRGYKEGEAVLRFKTPDDLGGMGHKNPAMRDFPLARINKNKHPRQNNKYRVWPLMNLAVPVDDMELGMTHVIRGKDHRDNAERQKMMFKVFGKEYPHAFFIGRIKFTDLELSKRKITAAIKEGKYESFEDERLPTVASLRKRGFKPEAFARFVEQRGLTEVDKVMSGEEFFDVIKRFDE